MSKGSPAAAAPPVDLAALSPWAPELAETFAALATDVALVLDEQGVIVKLAQHSAEPLLSPEWVGKAWADTVTVECRPKVARILSDVAETGIARRREINHTQPGGGSAAVAYTAVRLGEKGATLAVGHDLRAQAAMQQRFVHAQQALEKSYWQARQEKPIPALAAANSPLDDRDRSSPQSSKERTLPRPDQAQQELLRALDGLHERIGQDALPGLLRDAKRLIERHFLEQALARTGDELAVARELGISPRTLARRKAQRLRTTGS